MSGGDLKKSKRYTRVEFLSCLRHFPVEAGPFILKSWGKADNWDLFCQIGLRNNWNTLNATCARAVAVECGRRWTQNGIGHGGIRLRRQTLVDGSITAQGGSPCHAVCWASVPEEKTSLHLFPLTASTAGVSIYKASEQLCADFNHFSTDTDHYPALCSWMPQTFLIWTAGQPN